MTAREVYEGILIELNKLGAPDLLLDEFNYYINKGMYQYVNKRYTVYDTNQQTSDDLQVLKTSTVIPTSKLKQVGETQFINGANITEAKYETLLPSDYYHLLNCVLVYEIQKDYRCYNEGYKISMPAKRLTADMYAAILNNAWHKPQYKNPYYIVNNNPLSIDGDWANNDTYNNNTLKDKLLKRAGDGTAHNAWEDTNQDGLLTDADSFVAPTMLIDYGKDSSVFELYQVNLNYLKVPATVRITPEQIDMTEDMSQVMEFPDYVCREIIKDVVSLVMLRNYDPGLQAHMAVNESIPNVPTMVPDPKKAQQK